MRDFRGCLGGRNVIRIIGNQGIKGVLCVRYQGRNRNGIMKRENGGKEGLVKNSRNKMSLILQTEPKTLNPNIVFDYITIQTHYIAVPAHYI